MIPGPIYIYKCPHCGNILRNDSLLSGNTFGAKRYSDGRIIAPMLSENPDLTKCKQCHTFFWLSKLIEIGSIDYSARKERTNISYEWRYAKNAEFLNISDYFKALAQGLAENKGEEIYIRKKIWWAYNDRIRNSENIFKSKNDEKRWADNVNKLLALLDKTNVNEQIMRAEIHRNLGNFEQCIEILQSIDKDLGWVTEILKNECHQSNRWVVELNR
jgi:hypothetical protein